MNKITYYDTKRGYEIFGPGGSIILSDNSKKSIHHMHYVSPAAFSLAAEQAARYKHQGKQDLAESTLVNMTKSESYDKPGGIVAMFGYKRGRLFLLKSEPIVRRDPPFEMEPNQTIAINSSH